MEVFVVKGLHQVGNFSPIVVPHGASVILPEGCQLIWGGEALPPGPEAEKPLVGAWLNNSNSRAVWLISRKAIASAVHKVREMDDTCRGWPQSFWDVFAEKLADELGVKS